MSCDRVRLASQGSTATLRARASWALWRRMWLRLALAPWCRERLGTLRLAAPPRSSLRDRLLPALGSVAMIHLEQSARLQETTRRSAVLRECPNLTPTSFADAESSFRLFRRSTKSITAARNFRTFEHARLRSGQRVGGFGLPVVVSGASGRPGTDLLGRCATGDPQVLGARGTWQPVHCRRSAGSGCSGNPVPRSLHARSAAIVEDNCWTTSVPR